MTPEQRTRAIVHNAADRALSARGHWVPLSVRVAITDSVLAALAEQGYAIVPIPREAPRLVVHNMTSWAPYSPELAAEMLGWNVACVRDLYGDTVLVRLGLNGPVEFRRGGAEPSPAEVRETAAILRQATASGAAPQPSETPQGAQTGDGGISGPSDNPRASTGLSAPRADDLRRRYADAIRHAMFGPHSGDAAIDAVFDRSAAPAARAVMAVRDTELEEGR